MATCHPTRRLYGAIEKGLCRQCYNASQPSTDKCPYGRNKHTQGLCRQCALRYTRLEKKAAEGVDSIMDSKSPYKDAFLRNM